MNKGIISQIIGPVIDIRFAPEELPKLLNAINIENDGKTIVAEVAQHIGDDVVRCIALSSTDGLRRGTCLLYTSQLQLQSQQLSQSVFQLLHLLLRRDLRHQKRLRVWRASRKWQEKFVRQ